MEGDAMPGVAKPSSLEGNRLPWLIPAIIWILAAAVFLPALKNQFVDDDDWHLLTTNLYYRGLGWTHIKWMFGASGRYTGHYIPLTWLTFGLDYVLGGMNPFGYHLVNLLLHGANAVLFFFIGWRILALAAPEGGAPTRVSLDLSAAFSALFFALHPLRVESVAWVTERRDVLAGLFYLMTVLCYLKSCGHAGRAGQRRWFLASVVLFALSLLSKISGITLPLVLLVLDVYPLRRLPADPKVWLTSRFRNIWLEKIPFLLLVLPAAVMEIIVEAQIGAVRSLAEVGLAGRLALPAFSTAFYLWKTLVPLNLVPLYQLPIPFDPFRWPYFLSAAVVSALSAIFWFLRRRFPAGLAVWAAYLVTLAPVMGIVAYGVQSAADRNTYLACLGWALLIGGGLRTLWRPPAWLAFAALLPMSVLSWKQTQVWRDSRSLWRHAVIARPDTPEAQSNLGYYLNEDGKYKEAEEHLSIAVRLKGDFADAHNNLGIALVRQGKIDEAAAEYRQAIVFAPGNINARCNLGEILAYQGRLDEAIVQYRLVLGAFPDHVVARQLLDSALTAKSRAQNQRPRAAKY